MGKRWKVSSIFLTPKNNPFFKSNKYNDKKTGFYFLEESEMTFTKERNADPSEVQHYVTFKHFRDGPPTGLENPDILAQLLPS